MKVPTIFWVALSETLEAWSEVASTTILLVESSALPVTVSVAPWDAVQVLDVTFCGLFEAHASAGIAMARASAQTMATSFFFIVSSFT